MRSHTTNTARTRVRETEPGGWYLKALLVLCLAVMLPASAVGTVPAVQILTDSASQHLAGGDYDLAAAVLERALRIEPKNPELWHRLAQVYYQKGDFEQARYMAEKSRHLAGDEPALAERNDSLIALAEQASLAGSPPGRTDPLAEPLPGRPMLAEQSDEQLASKSTHSRRIEDQRQVRPLTRTVAPLSSVRPRSEVDPVTVGMAYPAATPNDRGPEPYSGPESMPDLQTTLAPTLDVATTAPRKSGNPTSPPPVRLVARVAAMTGSRGAPRRTLVTDTKFSPGPEFVHRGEILRYSVEQLKHEHEMTRRRYELERESRKRIAEYEREQFKHLREIERERRKRLKERERDRRQRFG